MILVSTEVTTSSHFISKIHIVLVKWLLANHDQLEANNNHKLDNPFGPMTQDWTFGPGACSQLDHNQVQSDRLYHIFRKLATIPVIKYQSIFLYQVFHTSVSW